MSNTPAIPNTRSMLATGALRVSDTLGRFELRKILGQGAQSTVWLAFDPRLEREVAIKVMRPSSGTVDQALSQWLDEVRSVGRVKHANIVPAYDADIQDEQPYLVFEYIAGQTLEQLLKKRGAMGPHEAVALMMDVLDAVAVAQAAGVVHRDLKPSNVLVDPVSLNGCNVGYLSPKAANGATPVPSMDIFSAGVALAEMLMGKPLIEERDP